MGLIIETSKENGVERFITLDEALHRLKQYYGRDMKELLSTGLVQTSFFYYEVKGE